MNRADPDAELKNEIQAIYNENEGRQANNVLAEGSSEALQVRIKQLEMKNEYLKKLNALVQVKEKSPKKTK